MQTPLNILKADLSRYESEYKSLKEISDRLYNELSEIDKKRVKFYADNTVLQEEINKLKVELEGIDPAKVLEEDKKLLEELAKIEELTKCIRNHNIGLKHTTDNIQRLTLQQKVATDKRSDANILIGQGKISIVAWNRIIEDTHKVIEQCDKEIASEKYRIEQLKKSIEDTNKKIHELKEKTAGKCPQGVKFKRLCSLRDELLARESIITELNNEYKEIDTKATELAIKLDILTVDIEKTKKQIAEYKEPENKNKNVAAVLSFLELVNSCLSVLGEGPIDDINDNNIMVNTAIQCINNSAVKELTKEWWFNTHIRVLNPDEENNITIKNTIILAIYSLDNHSTYGIRDDGYVYQYKHGYPTFLFYNPIKVKCVTQPDYDMLPMNAKNLLKCSAVLDFQTKYSADGNASAILASLYADAYATLHAEHIRHIKCNLLDNYSIIQRRNAIGYR